MDDGQVLYQNPRGPEQQNVEWPHQHLVRLPGAAPGATAPASAKGSKLGFVVSYGTSASLQELPIRQWHGGRSE